MLQFLKNPYSLMRENLRLQGTVSSYRIRIAQLEAKVAGLSDKLESCSEALSRREKELEDIIDLFTSAQENGEEVVFKPTPNKRKMN